MREDPLEPSEQLPNAHQPGWLQWILTHRLLLLMLLLLLAVVIAIAGAWWLAFIVAAAAVFGYFRTAEPERALEATKSLTDPNATLRDIENAPSQSNFAFIVTDPVTPITATSGTDVATTPFTTSASDRK